MTKEEFKKRALKLDREYKKRAKALYEEYLSDITSFRLCTYMGYLLRQPKE